MKKYSPTSPARRAPTFVDWRAAITRKEPEKSLTSGRAYHVGRNSAGRITVRHKGGGVKKLWREIDFHYDKKDVVARVMAIEYDPNRSSFIAFLVYRDGEKRYVLAPQNLPVGSEVITSASAPLSIGNRLPLGKIPPGTMVYNVELEPGRGAKLVRAAGSGAVVLAQEGAYTHLSMPSKEVRKVRGENWACVGALSNQEHGFLTIGNAGRNRRMGVRPTVRGTAMNPVDHPHGGGEGRTQVGRRRGPATPWGKPARGVKTRKRRKKSDRLILQRRG
ncbi:MAG: 50S ribosomal protein L2 [Candidatus Sungbacteria bacterium]|uniref:Large ribosomal subunit protein uL2 n=1 Tax=Candidatus Sungiibacteriota bacterium TaxID=2750080 RepID=A0A932R1U6_9BACT|nr:50S ribosomal protein L2 [Candidatus Sungbacteria bacterium]